MADDQPRYMLGGVSLSTEQSAAFLTEPLADQLIRRGCCHSSRMVVRQHMPRGPAEAIGTDRAAALANVAD